MKSLRPRTLAALDGNLDNIADNDVGSRFEDSSVSWVDSSVSESTSPTSEDDGSDDLKAPSPIFLKSIRKHSDRRLGIYGSLITKYVLESPSPDPLADSPVSDSTSPTFVGCESNEFEPLSVNVLEHSRKDLYCRFGIFGDTSKHILSSSEIPSPVPADDAVSSDVLTSRR